MRLSLRSFSRLWPAALWCAAAALALAQSERPIVESTGPVKITRQVEYAFRVDPMVHRPMIQQMAMTYLGGKSVRDPLAAPLHGDLRGLPPLLIQVGGRETLLDDAVRIADKAKKAGVDVTLEVWDAQIHVWQIFASRLDEAEDAIRKLGAFIRRHTA